VLEEADLGNRCLRALGVSLSKADEALDGEEQLV